MATAAKTTDEHSGEMGPRARRKLLAVLAVGGGLFRVSMKDDVALVLPAPCDLPARGNEVGILEYPKAEFPWETRQGRPRRGPRIRSGRDAEHLRDGILGDPLEARIYCVAKADMEVSQLGYQSERRDGRSRNLECPFMLRVDVADQAEVEAPAGNARQTGGSRVPRG